MSNTPVNDGFTLDSAIMIREKAKLAEECLNQAQALFLEVEEHTHAEIPELDDVIATASLCVDDINEGIDTYRNGGTS